MTDVHARIAPADRRFRRTVSCLATLSLVALSLGCASYAARPLISSGAASSYLEHTERHGLHIAVLDLSNLRTTEKHFDRDLPDYQFVPVQVLAELDSRSDEVFNLRREHLHLVLQDGTRLQAVDPIDVIDKVSFSHVRSFFSFLLLIPGPFVTASVSSANEELESDYLEKSLRSVRLSHNMRTFQGVVFFRVPAEYDGRVNTEDAFVEVVAHREGGTESKLGSRVEFPVHFSR